MRIILKVGGGVDKGRVDKEGCKVDIKIRASAASAGGLNRMLGHLRPDSGGNKEPINYAKVDK